MKRATNLGDVSVVIRCLFGVGGLSRLGLERFGVSGRILNIEEEPFSPSSSSELEITDANRVYLELHSLNIEILVRSFTWFYTVIHGSLSEVIHFVRTFEHRQGLEVACLEEIVFHVVESHSNNGNSSTVLEENRRWKVSAKDFDEARTQAGR